MLLFPLFGLDFIYVHMIATRRKISPRTKRLKEYDNFRTQQRINDVKLAHDNMK